MASLCFSRPRFHIKPLVEVLAADGYEHYRGRWEDKHESPFYLSSDLIIRWYARYERSHIGRAIEAQVA